MCVAITWSRLVRPPRSARSEARRLRCSRGHQGEGLEGAQQRHLAALPRALHAQRPRSRRPRADAGSSRPSSPPPSRRTTPRAAKTQWRRVADQLRPKVHKLATLMDEAEPDVLAYMRCVHDFRRHVLFVSQNARLCVPGTRREVALLAVVYRIEHSILPASERSCRDSVRPRLRSASRHSSMLPFPARIDPACEAASNALLCYPKGSIALSTLRLDKTLI